MNLTKPTMALEALLLVAASLMHQGIAVSQGDSHIKMFGQWCQDFSIYKMDECEGIAAKNVF